MRRIRKQKAECGMRNRGRLDSAFRLPHSAWGFSPVGAEDLAVRGRDGVRPGGLRDAGVHEAHRAVAEADQDAAGEEPPAAGRGCSCWSGWAWPAGRPWCRSRGRSRCRRGRRCDCTSHPFRPSRTWRRCWRSRRRPRTSRRRRWFGTGRPGTWPGCGRTGWFALDCCVTRWLLARERLPGTFRRTPIRLARSWCRNAGNRCRVRRWAAPSDRPGRCRS